MTFDEMRARTHALGYAVYAYDPAGAVTLEILSPGGETWRYDAPTLEAAIALAYPPAPAPAADNSVRAPAETVDVFG